VVLALCNLWQSRQPTIIFTLFTFAITCILRTSPWRTSHFFPTKTSWNAVKSYPPTIPNLTPCNFFTSNHDTSKLNQGFPAGSEKCSEAALKSLA
jgi:hypothetical protein